MGKDVGVLKGSVSAFDGDAEKNFSSTKSPGKLEGKTDSSGGGGHGLKGKATADNGPVTPERAKQLFDLVAKRDDIAWKFPWDGCYARAQIMARAFQKLKVPVEKVWTFSPNPRKPGLWVLTPNVPGGVVRWPYHVAVTIEVVGTDGEVQDMVIDPSMETGPVTPAKWAADQHAKLPPVPSQLGEPPEVPPGWDGGGTGYRPGEGDPPGGPDEDARRTMTNYKLLEGQGLGKYQAIDAIKALGGW
jgi:hypothetical protein